MGRPKRADEAGGIYHMLNRANRPETIFHKDDDYEAFENLLLEALALVDLQLYIIASCPITGFSYLWGPKRFTVCIQLPTR